MRRRRLFPLFLALTLVVSCGVFDALPFREADRLEVPELAHVSSSHMFVVLRNPGPYRLTKFRFELGQWNRKHSQLQCHAVNVSADVPPRATIRIRLPLAGRIYRCDRSSSVPPSILEQLSDIFHDRVHLTQVCAITDDPSWQWSLIRVEGRSRRPSYVGGFRLPW